MMVLCTCITKRRLHAMMVCVCMYGLRVFDIESLSWYVGWSISMVYRYLEHEDSRMTRQTEYQIFRSCYKSEERGPQGQFRGSHFISQMIH